MLLSVTPGAKVHGVCSEEVADAEQDWYENLSPLHPFARSRSVTQETYQRARGKMASTRKVHPINCVSDVVRVPASNLRLRDDSLLEENRQVLCRHLVFPRVSHCLLVRATCEAHPASGLHAAQSLGDPLDHPGKASDLQTKRVAHFGDITACLGLCCVLPPKREAEETTFFQPVGGRV